MTDPNAPLLFVHDPDAAADLGIADRARRLGYRVATGAEPAGDPTGVETPSLSIVRLRGEGDEEALRSAEARRRDHGVPFVIVAAEGDIGSMREVIRRGPSAYLTDPVGDATLAATIAIAIDHARVEREAAQRERVMSDSFRAERLQSEERYRVLFEDAADGIFICDGQGRLIDANPAACRMVGYEREEMMGHGMGELYAPSEKVPPRIREINEGQTLASIRTLRRKDGSELKVDALTTRTGPGLVHGRIRDVTERIRVEEALRKSEENLREAQKLDAVGRLAGGVAHDFNNLLTVVLSAAEALVEALDPASEESALARDIHRAGTRAGELTRQLLTFARKQVSAPRVLDVSEQIGSFLRFLTRVIGEDVHVTTDLAPDLPKVLLDPLGLEQILLNLVVNARDAMPGGGSITLRTRRGELDVGEGPAAGVVIEVEDTGAGMDEGTRAHVFEPFFTTKDVGRGTGLGLATVYGIVKQGKGDISVTSAPGTGSTFRIVFPAATGQALAREDPPRAKAEAGSETILVVEDDNSVRAVTVRILSNAGYRTVAASSAEEAIALSASMDRIDLLVTDVVMPGMKGPALAADLGRSRPGIRVLFVSGYSPDSAHVAKIGRLLSKPFAPRDLLAAVRGLLDDPGPPRGARDPFHAGSPAR